MATTDMDKTKMQYTEARRACREVFANKLNDYGAAWRILRPSSLTDQLYIKAQRIRELELKGYSAVDEGIEPEFVGIVNYALVALVQLELGHTDRIDFDHQRALLYYEKYFDAAFELMLRKNHDYGEAWRNMRVSSLTDLILMKIYRTKQIEDNRGATIASEGIDANYFDMVNYAVFALIKLKQPQL